MRLAHAGLRWRGSGAQGGKVSGVLRLWGMEKGVEASVYEAVGGEAAER